jgi:ribonuclease HI
MNTSLIYNEAIAQGMPGSMASLIVTQARHESKDFTSHVFLTDNNLNGYKYVGQKIATKGLKSPEGDSYAHYTDVKYSVQEICNWIKKRQRLGVFPQDLTTIKTPEQYAQLLKSVGYYGDTVANYTKGLKKYFKDYGAATGVSIGLVLLAVFFFVKKFV